MTFLNKQNHELYNIQNGKGKKMELNDTPTSVGPNIPQYVRPNPRPNEYKCLICMSTDTIANSIFSAYSFTWTMKFDITT